MKYLCLVYIEEKKLDAMSQSESDALIDESLAYDEVLRKSGHYLVSGVHDRQSLLGRAQAPRKHGTSPPNMLYFFQNIGTSARFLERT